MNWQCINIDNGVQHFCNESSLYLSWIFHIYVNMIFFNNKKWNLDAWLAFILAFHNYCRHCKLKSIAHRLLYNFLTVIFFFLTFVDLISFVSQTHHQIYNNDDTELKSCIFNSLCLSSTNYGIQQEKKIMQKQHRNMVYMMSIAYAPNTKWSTRSPCKETVLPRDCTEIYIYI